MGTPIQGALGGHDSFRTCPWRANLAAQYIRAEHFVVAPWLLAIMRNKHTISSCATCMQSNDMNILVAATMAHVPKAFPCDGV